SGVAPVDFEYGVDSRGRFQTAIKIGGAGERSEWRRDYFDLAGRKIATHFADGAIEETLYNDFGQVERMSDPDGVTTLYSYNIRGEQEIAAVDLDRNGQIDFAGADR